MGGDGRWGATLNERERLVPRTTQCRPSEATLVPKEGNTRGLGNEKRYYMDQWG